MPAYPPGHSDDIAASLKTVEANTAVSAVAKGLLETFTRGDIEPGTRLPSERQLALSLGVGRSAVREALAALEILGIVDVKPGSGTYLHGTVSELLPQTLSWGLMLGAPRTAELVEMRGALEIYAARLAATRMDAASVSRLGDHVETMRHSLDNLKRFVEADSQFHREIALAAENTVLVELLQSIRSLIRVWVDRAVHDRENAEVAMHEHAAVHEAIARRDPDAAASAMAAHMTTAGGRLINSVAARDH